MVLVSHRREFIFLKTRKTAGTSIELLLEPFCAPPGHVATEVTYQRVSREGIIGARGTRRRGLGRYFRPDWRNHKPAAAVRRDLGERRWRRYAKITSVRDPFDRMVSLFHWMTRVDPDSEGAIPAFRSFVKEGRWADDRRVVCIDDAFVPEHTVRFEHLRHDLAALGRRLDLTIDLSGLPHAKGKPRRLLPSAAYYDPASIDVVRTRLAWVFENFDYPDRPGDDQSGSEDTP